jgi:DNA gyrase subunit A
MEIGTVKFVNIEDEVRSAYLDYAMSVITARALPDVRDGLKPVQRRILYAMYDMGLRPDRPYRKSARIVGEVLGKYHPHGDAPVYDAMVRLAQDFSMRYPLVDGQGNFGSVDGDAPAAMRYTEARLAPVAMESLADIDKDTVDFVPNFDESLTQPSVLPSMLPNLLLQGASGIAVGMATNVPSHNLAEVCDALAYIIDRYDSIGDITPDELMRFIPGPDFPTGAAILGVEGIRAAYGTGRGRLIVRGKAHFEDLAGGRQAVVLTEIPFQVNKTALIEKIAALARERRIDSISDLRDESDRSGMRIVIELKRAADARTTLNQLLKYTPFQSTFGVNMLALVDGEPRVLPLKRALVLFLEHRQQVIRRRSEYELQRARHRAHVLEGLRIALDHLDDIIDTIRRSQNAETARSNLMRRFKLSEIQAQAILDLQLRRLAALERKRIHDEHAEVLNRIAYLADLLANPRKVLGLIKDDLLQLKAKYGDERRTQIIADGVTELRAEDLIAEEEALITITRRGYIKRQAADNFRAQRRGGRGVRGTTTRDADVVRDFFTANTRDRLLFFTDRGRVFQLPAHQVPDASRASAGTPIVNLIQLARNERVTAARAISEAGSEGARYLTTITRLGKIKRTDLREFDAVRPSGLTAILIEEGDELCWVKLTGGRDEIILVTQRGQALRFRETDVRPMGRAAGGVMAIRLKPGDEVAGADVVVKGCDLLVVTRAGYGKRTRLEEYRTLRRHSQGVMTVDARSLNDIGLVADARVVREGDEVSLVSDKGVVIRTEVRDLSRQGRVTRGTRVMNLDAGQALVSMALIRPPGGGASQRPQHEAAPAAVDKPAPYTQRSRRDGQTPGRQRGQASSTWVAKAKPGRTGQRGAAPRADTTRTSTRKTGDSTPKPASGGVAEKKPATRRGAARPAPEAHPNTGRGGATKAATPTARPTTGKPAPPTSTTRRTDLPFE